MPDSSLTSENDLVPDPKHDPIPWDMYRFGAVGLGVLAAGWWAGSSTTGVVRLVCRLVAVLGGVYGAYMLVLSAGWQVFFRGLERWMNRARRNSAEEGDESLLELRFGLPRDEGATFVGDLMDDVNAELGDAGECGEVQVSGGVGSGGGTVTYYLHGHDLDRMVEAVRRVAARFSLPPDAYVWAPSARRPGFGTVLGARQK